MKRALKTRTLAADPAGIASAAALLRAGELVAFPTETVYGLGGDASDDRAVAAIFAAKGRPEFNPLIVHLGTLDEVWRLVEISEMASALAAAFWPGALTMVLPRRQGCAVSPLASAGLPTLAVRVPSHPVARALLRQVARPVAAPSANRSGRISPTRADHVRAELDGCIAAILDGGDCAVGLESTVIALAGDQPVLLRPGGVTAEALTQVVGDLALPASGAADQPQSPGQLASHYAPGKPLRLEASSTAAGEALLAFGPAPPATTGPMRNLSDSGDLTEAAANLFRLLRELDETPARSIAVMPVPEQGLGRAINDRLRRAAHGDRLRRAAHGEGN